MQARFDLAQLDAKTANLHLVIDASHIFQGTVGAISHQVAGPVQASTRGGKRIGDKTLRTQSTAIQVAACQASLTNVQLPRAALGHQVQVAIEEVPRQVRDRCPDGAAGRAVEVGQRQRSPGHMHGGFGDAVHVDQLWRMIAITLEPRTQRLDVQGFAAEYHIPQGAARAHRIRARHLHQLLERRRCLVQYRDLFATEQGMELFGRTAGFVRHDHQPATIQQRAEDLPDREVESVGVEQRPDILRAKAEPALGGGEQTQHVMVGQQRALGLTRRAGGIDHVGQMIAAHRHLRLALVVARHTVIEVQLHQSRWGRQALEQWLLAKQQGHGAVLDDIGQALTRGMWVERHIGTARLEDRQQTDDHREPTFGHQPDPHLRTHALFPEPMRPLVGAAVEIAIRQRLGIKAQGDGLRCARRTGSDDFMQASLARIRRYPWIELGNDCLPLRLIMQLAVVQHQAGILAHLPEQQTQMGVELCNGPLVKRRSGIVVMQRQAFAEPHHQGQRVIALLVVAQVGELQFAWAVLLQCLRHRVVFEHQVSVKQRLAPLASPALDLEQRRVFLLAQGQVLRLHGLQPLRHTVLRPRGGDDRQGIDEQADLLLDTFELRRAPRNRGAEAYRVLAAVTLQKQQPGRLHQGIDRDFLPPTERHQTLGLCLVEQAAIIVMSWAGSRLAPARRQGPRQMRRSLQRSQLGLPKLLAVRQALRLEPADIVAVAPGTRGQSLAAVALQHFTQQLRTAPTVHEDMMMGVDQVVAPFGGANHRQTQQRAPDQIEAHAQLFAGQFIQGHV